MQTLRQDLRHAMRTLARRPGLTAVSVATLALGLGGATAIFSVADAVVLRPLPFAEPDRIVLVRQSDARRGHPVVEIGYPAFRAWRDESRSFTAMAGMPNTNQAFVLTGGQEPVRIMGRSVTARFFDVLGVQPALGRGFTDADDRPGAARVVVLSDALWRERFGADPSVIGRSLTFDGQPAHTVVGVMPRGFAYPREAELWTTLVPGAEWALDAPGVWWMAAIGRLAPGASAASARPELDGIWTRLYGTHLDATGFGVVLTPVTDAVLGSSRAALLALLAGVVLVLMIACANVAGLQIVQTVERRTEWAVRQALGASRPRLARMLMAESLVLTALGGLGGAAIAAWGTPLLVAAAPADVPRLDQVALNARTLLFGLAACAVTGLLAALAP
ncbi:MAG TPA: ABC transporter permease, partial [Vicinamibacteria bacterium]|nr:ABC transporter permease [Vicinamibacteria bacterium]